MFIFDNNWYIYIYIYILKLYLISLDSLIPLKYLNNKTI